MRLRNDKTAVKKRLDCGHMLGNARTVRLGDERVCWLGRFIGPGQIANVPRLTIYCSRLRTKGDQLYHEQQF